MASDDELPKSSKKDKKSKKEKVEKRAREPSSSTDSGPEDREPVKKVRKGAAGSTLGKHMTDDDGNEMLELGSLKFATVRSFKGKTFVDIREFYQDKASGKMKPGKKGISLNLEQFKNLQSHVDAIETKLNAH